MEKNSSTQVARGAPLTTLVRGLACGAVVGLLLAGCGLVKLGYRHGDTVGLFWIDRYFDLSRAQEAFVKPRLHELLVWHRTTQLPDYVAFAETLQQKATQPISGAEVTAIGMQARRRVMTSVDHALPAMADLALELTPDNLDALSRRFADDDAKWRREFMKGDLESQQKARYEKTLERAEEWYGRLSADQRDRIRALSDARPIDNVTMLAERQRRERELVVLLTKVERDKPPRDEVVAAMKAYADRFETNPDPARRAFLGAFRTSTEEMDAAIHDLATPEQRARAVAKLQDWIDDFRSLAADPG